jgi:uncharacterized protein YfbU (UPF0304 family)
MTAINLTNNKRFTTSKSNSAKLFLDLYKFKGDTLKRLQDIAKKGYTIEGNKILSIFEEGKRKKHLKFAIL